MCPCFAHSQLSWFTKARDEILNFCGALSPTKGLAAEACIRVASCCDTFFNLPRGLAIAVVSHSDSSASKRSVFWFHHNPNHTHDKKNAAASQPRLCWALLLAASWRNEAKENGIMLSPDYLSCGLISSCAQCLAWASQLFYYWRLSSGTQKVGFNKQVNRSGSESFRVPIIRIAR